MIPSTLKTIFVDGELDDSSVLLDVQHPYRDKDLLLTNHFDDIEDDVHDRVRQKKKKKRKKEMSNNLFICVGLFSFLLLLFLSPRTWCYACICYAKLFTNFIHKNTYSFDVRVTR
jgi:hypothetical protein